MASYGQYPQQPYGGQMYPPPTYPPQQQAGYPPVVNYGYPPNQQIPPQQPMPPMYGQPQQPPAGYYQNQNTVPVSTYPVYASDPVKPQHPPYDQHQQYHQQHQHQQPQVIVIESEGKDPNYNNSTPSNYVAQAEKVSILFIYVYIIAI